MKTLSAILFAALLFLGLGFTRVSAGLHLVRLQRAVSLGPQRLRTEIDRPG